jgi:hypothetical protein
MTALYSFIPNISPTHLKKRLTKPETVYPKPRTQVMCHVPQIPSSTPLPLAQQPVVSTSQPNPIPRTTPIQPRTIIHCFKCDSPNRIKWYCPQYQCHGCR